MAKKKKPSAKTHEAIKKAVERGNKLEPAPGHRIEIEAALGRKMHQIGKAQEIAQRHNAILQALHAQANELDMQLKKLDG
ncbi:hypothetical protein LCGC14_2126370 [marine sediment metagenome]|uniref:Uncharacterized protein n=1 Tax=marine sediment metagenome TaxID=412755 RepID=A0A0F9EPZ0_9ZZZZ|nr:hypothetical protein [Phycisphaerales bacterium]